MREEKEKEKEKVLGQKSNNPNLKGGGEKKTRKYKTGL